MKKNSTRKEQTRLTNVNPLMLDLMHQGIKEDLDAFFDKIAKENPDESTMRAYAFEFAYYGYFGEGYVLSPREELLCTALEEMFYRWIAEKVNN